MCGIVGAVSTRNIVPILVEGLKRLEYRGYDSCGVAVHQGGELRARAARLRVAELSQRCSRGIEAGTGIAHTRWATHGAPAVHNAHPHFSAATGPANRLRRPRRRAASALVHNGIIENHDELRAELQAKGYVFDSQTDTEVIAHLVHHLYDGDLLEAVQRAPCRGCAAPTPSPCSAATSRTAWWARAPARRWCWAWAGRVGENFLASDAMALAGVTDQIVYLEEGDVVDLQLGKLLDHRRAPTGGRYAAVQRPVRTVHAHSGAAELGPYRHYMQKEIFEQPRAIADTLEGVEGITPSCSATARLPRVQGHRPVLILACGTSYYSGCTAKYWLEASPASPPGGDRQRVPLPRQRARPAHAGRHHQPERRDRRHAGRAAHAQSLGMRTR
jgi:glutamine---fructose-6-phosphate transaminase (isomerizing)